MTTPIIPGLIGDLFKKEIYKIQEDVAKRICEVYALDLNEVTQKIKLENININHPRLRVYIKHETMYGSNTNTSKCIAISSRKKKDGPMTRCPKSKVIGCHFCKAHMQCFLESTLLYGTIYDHPEFDEVVYKIHNPDSEDEEILEQCIARIYDKNERTLEQCTRCQETASNPLCKIHAKQQKLQYGTIHDDIPECILKKKANKIY